MTAGIFRVAKERQEELRPSLLGAWNVKSPQFVAQDAIDFEAGGRRYEPGVLNAQGLIGMQASIDLLTGLGINTVAARLLELKAMLCDGLDELGFELLGPRSGSAASGITSFTDRSNARRIDGLYETLTRRNIVTSYRQGRDGVPYIRFSPHFYNTPAEITQVLGVMREART